MSDRQRLGALGERVAAHYLEQRGYRVIERNVRRAEGEIDLVAALSVAMQDRLCRLAEGYAAEHPELPAALRLDVRDRRRAHGCADDRAHQGRRRRLGGRVRASSSSLSVVASARHGAALVTIRLTDRCERQGGDVPLYPYHCRECGETTEIFARTPNEDLGSKLRCAHCDSKDIERRMAPPGLPADEKQLRGMLRRRAESEGIGRSHLDG